MITPITPISNRGILVKPTELMILGKGETRRGKKIKEKEEKGMGGVRKQGREEERRGNI